MMRLWIITIIALSSMQASFAVNPVEQAIALENATIPENLKDASVLKFVEGFSRDGNLEQLENIVLGITHQRSYLLNEALMTVAQLYPEASKDVIYTVSKYIPEARKNAFLTMSAHLKSQNKPVDLEKMYAMNNTVHQEIQNQFLSVETAAGPEEDFDALLKDIGIH